jgi:pimeloyl-ACP methyl ester carboxylesterase
MIPRWGSPLHHVVHGSGEPMLFLSGYAVGSRSLRSMVPPFAERFTCITLDQRGAGLSRAPWSPFTTSQMSADAVRVLDELGIGSAHVYGLSMGGMVAQELAIRFPHRVRGLVLGATTAGGLDALKPELQSMLAGSRDVRAVVSWDAPLVGAWLQAWAALLHDTSGRLGRIQSPTLVVHGDRDLLVPFGNAEQLVAAIPDSTLVRLRGSGHLYATDSPEESAARVLAWFDEREPIAPGWQSSGQRFVEPLDRALSLPIGLTRAALSNVRFAASLGKRAVRRPG